MSPRRPPRSTRRAPARRSASARRSRSTRARSEPARRPAPATAGGPAPGMQAINMYLAVANIPASIEFLERAFGFERGVVLDGPDGDVRYAEMRHRGSVVMLVRRSEAGSPTDGAPGLYTYVDDVDAALARARDAGAGAGDAEDQAWGDRTATVTDPDGYRWVLATFRKLVPFS